MLCDVTRWVLTLALFSQPFSFAGLPAVCVAVAGVSGALFRAGYFCVFRPPCTPFPWFLFFAACSAARFLSCCAGSLPFLVVDLVVRPSSLCRACGCVWPSGSVLRASSAFTFITVFPVFGSCYFLGPFCASRFPSSFVVDVPRPFPVFLRPRWLLLRVCSVLVFGSPFPALLRAPAGLLVWSGCGSFVLPALHLCGFFSWRFRRLLSWFLRFCDCLVFRAPFFLGSLVFPVGLVGVLFFLCVFFVLPCSHTFGFMIPRFLVFSGPGLGVWVPGFTIPLFQSVLFLAVAFVFAFRRLRWCLLVCFFPPERFQTLAVAPFAVWLGVAPLSL